jgi:hypothetical protein
MADHRKSEQEDSSMPKLFNILLTKMNIRLLLVGFIPEKT